MYSHITYVIKNKHDNLGEEVKEFKPGLYLLSDKIRLIMREYV